MKGLKTEENVAATRGYALALGAVPPRLLVLPAGRLDAILQVLRVQSHHSCRIAGEPDPDTRKHCIEAMTEIIEKLAVFPAALTVEQVARVLTVLLTACEDYSVDARGDVGSWIRAAAIKSIERVLYVCFRMLDVNSISSISSSGGGGGGQSVQSLQLPTPPETVGVKKGANEEGGISSFRRLSTADPALGVGSILSTGRRSGNIYIALLIPRPIPQLISQTQRISQPKPPLIPLSIPQSIPALISLLISPLLSVIHRRCVHLLNSVWAVHWSSKVRHPRWPHRTGGRGFVPCLDLLPSPTGRGWRAISQAPRSARLLVQGGVVGCGAERPPDRAAGQVLFNARLCNRWSHGANAADAADTCWTGGIVAGGRVEESGQCWH